MHYNLVDNDFQYQGIERTFSPLKDFQNHKVSNTEFKQLLEYELKVIELGFNMPENEENFEKLCALYKTLKKEGLDCDVIVYDDKPINQAYGRSLIFLGIDIEADKTECPLADEHREAVRIELNSNGLCPNIATAAGLTKNWEKEYKSFNYVYVYKVIIQEDNQ